jgi:hypothetical protein
MTDFPATLAPKVASLLRLLGSPVDGEALAAARALDRTLKGVGRDLHALAAIVERPEPPPRIVFREPPPAPVRGSAGWVEEAREKIAWLLEEPAQLSPWEDEFLRSLRGRFRAGRPLSEKQAACLAKIYFRCFVSGDHP